MTEHESVIRRHGRGWASRARLFHVWDEDPHVAAEWCQALAPSHAHARVLLADDDAETRAALAHALRREGYDVVECRDGHELLAKLQRSVLSGELPECDLIVSDIRMPDGSAFDVLAEFLDCDGLPPVILMSGYCDATVRTRAHDLGAARVFEKPFRVSELLAEVHRFVHA